MFEGNQILRGNETKFSRRMFVSTGALAGVAAFLHFHRSSFTVEAREMAAKDTVAKDVRIVQFSPAGQRLETVTVPTVVKSDAEWKAQLSHDSYQITRRAGTEYPNTSPLENVHDKGIFSCICCETALFNENTKFDSGTGWPSFWQPIAKENVHETSDLSLGEPRTAVSCRRCEAHLGHVFDDGPRPTGLRYCMNGVAMKFTKA